MDFPVFINKWVIGFKPIKYTPFWYWFRLTNHSNWRMDDNIRYWDFWNSLNQGILDMNYQAEFEKFWGVKAKSTTTYVSQDDYDKLQEMIAETPKPIPGLIDLMNRKSPFEND